MRVFVGRLSVPFPQTFPVEASAYEGARVTAGFCVNIDYEGEAGHAIDPRKFGEIIESMMRIRDDVANEIASPPQPMR